MRSTCSGSLPPKWYSEWDQVSSQETFVETWQCIQTVTVHQKPLTRFREITETLTDNLLSDRYPGTLRIRFFDETRYVSSVSISDRMITTRKTYEQLMSLDQEFQDGIGKQKVPTHLKMRTLCSYCLMFSSTSNSRWILDKTHAPRILSWMGSWKTLQLWMNTVYTESFWWRGEGGSSRCFHTRKDEISSRDMDRRLPWRGHRQMHRIDHVLIVRSWALLVYRGVNSL